MANETLWTLAQRHPLPMPRRRGAGHVFSPLVGQRLLAVKIPSAGLLLLNRQDLSVHGEVVPNDMIPLEWCDDLLLLTDHDSNLVAWDGPRCREAWTAPAQGGFEPWKGHLVLAPSADQVEIRNADGGRERLIPLDEGGLFSFRIVADMLVYHTESQELVGLDLVRGGQGWRLSLPSLFGEAVSDSDDDVVLMVPTPDGRSLLVHWRPAVGLLDPTLGRFRWKGEAATTSPPAIAHNRVAFLHTGALILFDELTGRAIVNGQKVAPTVNESPPAVLANGFVVVDDLGHIVTIHAEDGTLLGLQKEHGGGFNGCVLVDGRLLVGGSDGALWEFKRTDDGDARRPLPLEREKKHRSDDVTPAAETSKRSPGRRPAAGRSKK